MQNLARTVCEKFREARRTHGLTQTALATEVGCQQAALSMFEKGNGTKLSAEYVEKIAKRLGLDLAALQKQVANEEQNLATAPIVSVGFCPEPECPSRTRMSVQHGIRRCGTYLP